MAQYAERGVAVVTGAGRRIGRVLALTAARAGFDVAVHHRDSEAEASSAADEIRALGRQAETFAADLANTDQLSDLIPAIATRMGPVTLLVNSASLFLDDSVGILTPEQYDAHQSVNLRAPVLLAQGFADHLPAGLAGQIVNIIDQRVLKPDPQFFSYSLSKAGLWWATRTLAQALAPQIRVNAIGPGPTLRSIHQTAEAFDEEARSALLERSVSPDEIGAALAYLIDAPSVTGQMIVVDSGQHLSWNS